MLLFLHYREDQQRWNGRSGRAFEFNTKSCDNTPQQVTYVEEVEARISLTFAVRGLLQIHLVSPSGIIIYTSLFKESCT